MVRIATIQAAPVLLDARLTLEKAVSLIGEVGASADLVLLPESFIPGYPVWLWASSDGGQPGLEADAYLRFFENSIEVPGPETSVLGEAARAANAVVAIGVSERESRHGRGTLYNTLLIFDHDGSLIGRHRKLIPTYRERTVWGQGDGSTLLVHETDAGRIGGLICWENLMPLPRYALYSQGEQIHLAPTADAGAAWQHSLHHLAYEGRMFVVASCQVLSYDMISADPAAAGFSEGTGWIMRGGSAIVAPGGDCPYLAGPLWEEEGILQAEIDLSEVARAKHSLDVAGHYARPDVFELRIDRSPQAPVYPPEPASKHQTSASDQDTRRGAIPLPD